jgi:hypothetical protein
LLALAEGIRGAGGVAVKEAHTVHTFVFLSFMKILLLKIIYVGLYVLKDDELLPL